MIARPHNGTASPVRSFLLMRGRRLQYRLVTLLLVVSAFSLPLGWFASVLAAKRRERESVAHVVRGRGNKAWRASERDEGPRPSHVPALLVPILGADFSDPVTLVTVVSDPSGRIDLKPLKNFPYLQYLTLWGPVTDQDLARLPDYQYLEELYLVESKITDTGIASLVRFPRLRVLRASDARVTGSGIAALAHLEEVCYIELDFCPIADGGAVALGQLRHLVWLSLYGTNISDDGLKSLGALRDLEGLNLGNTKIAGPGLQHLASCASLRSLHLHNTGIGDESVEFFSGLVQVRQLIVIGTNFSPTGVVQLQHMLPQCEIIVEN